MNSLIRPQLQRLHQAVVLAFGIAEIEQLLTSDLGVRLWNVVSTGSLSDVAFDVLMWCEQQGRLEEFLNAITRARPDNTEVQEAAFDVRVALRIGQLQQARQAQLDAVSPRTAFWAVAAPRWTTDLAVAAGFPSGQPTAVFELLTRNGVGSLTAESTTLRSDPEAGVVRVRVPETFRADPVEAYQVLANFARQAGPSDVRDELAAVGKAVRVGLAAVALPDQPSDLAAWAELATGADQSDNVVRDLESRVDGALSSRSFDEAAVWIRAAERVRMVYEHAAPEDEALLKAALGLCGRRSELVLRAAGDDVRLAEYVERPKLEQVYRELVERDPAHVWALHFLGLGGVGKSMLMRYIQRDVRVVRHGAVARIDFDYLSPDYPAFAPALLLEQLADELRAFAPNDTTVEAFKLFAFKTRRLHESLTGKGRATRSFDELINDEEFADILDQFAEAVGQLPRPLVVLIDTCEELDRPLQSGERSPGVVATWSILKRLKIRLPDLRVVLGGRRNLFTGNEPRLKHFRVVRVGGFDPDEARRFLASRLRGRQDLHRAILERCRERSSGPTEDDSVRYNPLDLSVYATWAAGDPELTEATIRSARVDALVEYRIVGRVRDEQLRRLIGPAVAVGRFDRPLLRAAAGLPRTPPGGEPDELDPWLDAFTWLEWVYARPPWFEVDAALLPRLRRYYYSADPAGMAIARRLAAIHLLGDADVRAPQEIDSTFLDQMLTGGPDLAEQTVEAWDRLVDKLVRYGGPEAVESRTVSLVGLRPDAAPEEAFAQPVVRAVRAARAAALLQMRRLQEAVGLWQSLEADPAMACPATSADRKLARRVLGHRLAAWPQEDRAASDRHRDEFLNLLRTIPLAELDPSIFFALVAGAEGVVERVEPAQSAPDPSSILRLAQLGRELGPEAGAGAAFSDVLASRCVTALVRSGGEFWTCAWSPDGARILSGSMDSKLRVWDATSGLPLSALDGHTSPVLACAWSPDGARLLSASHDRTLRIWHADSGACLAVLEGHSGWVLACAWSPEDGRMLSGSGDMTLRVWDAAGRPLSVLEGHTDLVHACAWSPDGARLLSASHDRTLRIWHADSGECLAVLEGHTDCVHACAWSPDGDRILSGSMDSTLRVWDAGSGRPMSVLDGHTSPVLACAWSPDGTRLLSASQDDRLLVWDAVSGKCLAVLKGHEGKVLACAWSPDGGRLLSASHDATLRVWDADSGDCLAELPTQVHSRELIGQVLERVDRERLETPISIDWAAPDHLASRLALQRVQAGFLTGEAVRSIHQALPTTLVAQLNPRADIDQDRLAGVVLGLKASVQPVPDQELNARPQSFALQWSARCRAHTNFAPAFVAYATELTRKGRVSEGLEVARGHFVGAETFGKAFAAVEEANLVELWIARRMRLGDFGSRGGDYTARSADPAALELRLAVVALGPHGNALDLSAITPSGNEHLYWRTYAAPTFDQRRTAVAWADRWLSREPLRGTASAESWAVALDCVEADRMAGRENRDLPSPPDWPALRARGWPAADAFRVHLRAQYLFGTTSSALQQLVEVLGERQAADIASDEGELLALRLPDAGEAVLRRAAQWYQAGDDPIGSFVSQTAAQMAAIRAGRLPLIHELVDLVAAYSRVVRVVAALRHQEEMAAGMFSEEWLSATPREWMPWMARFVAVGAVARDATDGGDQWPRLAAKLAGADGELPTELTGWRPTGARRIPGASYPTLLIAESEPGAEATAYRAVASLEAIIAYERENPGDGPRIERCDPFHIDLRGSMVEWVAVVRQALVELSSVVVPQSEAETRWGLAVGAATAWVPWEHLLAQALADLVPTAPDGFVRQAHEARRAAWEPPKAELVCFGRSKTNEAIVERGWFSQPMLPDPAWWDLFRMAGLNPSPRLITSYFLDDFPTGKERSLFGPTTVHVIGEFVELRGGVRVDLGFKRFFRAADVREWFGDRAFFFLQQASREGVAWTRTDVEQARLLRVFGAEMHALGAAGVVTLPPLDFAAAAYALLPFRAAITGGVGFPMFAVAVDLARRLVAGGGNGLEPRESGIVFYSSSR